MYRFYCFTRFVRKWYYRGTNQYYNIVNHIKFKFIGVKSGNHSVIHGPIAISLERNSDVLIGNNFCLLSGRSLNPLSRNLRACIKVNEGGKLRIGNNVGMSSATIWCHKNIIIGNHVNVGANTIILDSDCHSLNYIERHDINVDMSSKKDRAIVIGDDVLIGVNCIILKGVTIGERTVIGAGSVVTRSIPEDCIAAGNPAVIVKDNRMKADKM